MTPGRRSRGARFMALSTPKGCRCRPSSIPRASRTAPSTSSGGAALVLDKIRNRFPWLELVWTDNGYYAWQVEAAVVKVPVLRLEIVKRRPERLCRPPAPLGRRANFLLFGRNRRIAKDYENLAGTLAAFVTLASIQIPVRRTGSFLWDLSEREAD
jgi:hypothetical protein